MESQEIKPQDPKDEILIENKNLSIWEALFPIFLYFKNEIILKNGLKTAQILKVKSSKAAINEEQAKEVSGIQNIQWIDDFENILHSIIHYATSIFLNTNENDRYAHTVSYRDIRFIEQLRNKYPLHQYETNLQKKN